jgi:hypothetical protein
MFQRIIIFALFLCMSQVAYAQYFNSRVKSAVIDIFSKLKIETTLSMRKISSGRVVCDSTVTTPEEGIQEMKFIVAGLHKRKCDQAIPKMTHFENWHEYAGPIEISKYDPNSKAFYIRVDGTMLPTALTIDMTVPRMEGEGTVPFVFPPEKGGLFPGLQGKVHAFQAHNRCLFILTANWKGKETPYPNFMVEMFTQAVNEYSLRQLLRATK